MDVKKILVPIDFQPQSINTLEYAVKVAQSINAKLSCLHVIEDPDYIAAQSISREKQNKIRRDAEVRLAEMSNNVLKDVSIQYEIIVTKGKVYKQIAEKAKDLNARFIVMGRSDSSVFKKHMAGTNAKYVIGNSATPVITVGNDSSLFGDHLLLPLDLSKAVRANIEKAIELADMLNKKVTVVSILQKDWGLLKSDYQKKLFEIKTLLENQNISCTTELIDTQTPICDAINGYAKEINADLIFLLAKQATRETGSYIGKTAQDIINRSEFAVLTATSKVEAQDKALISQYF